MGLPPPVSHRPRSISPAGGLLAFSLALFVGTACRIARPDAPEWIEAHGRGQIISLAADADGALALGSNRRVYGYPGPYGQPWIERFAQEGTSIAAGGGAVAWIGVDGTVRVLPAGGALRDVPGSRDWHASALALGPDGALYVVSSNRGWVATGDTLAEAVCDGAPVAMMAASSSAIYLVRTDGTITERRGGQCQPMPVPFHAVDVAAAGDALAAVDVQGNPWRRRDNAWTRLPQPRVYRPDAFPYDVLVRQVAMTSAVLWARTDGMHAFILSDPT